MERIHPKTRTPTVIITSATHNEMKESVTRNIPSKKQRNMIENKKMKN